MDRTERVWASPVPWPAPRRGVVRADASLHLLGTVWRTTSEALRLSVGFDVSFPTGRQASYSGDGLYHTGGAVAASGRRGRVDYTAGLSVRGHSAAHAGRAGRRPTLMTAQLGAGLYWGHDRWHAGLELPLAVAVGSTDAAGTQNHVWAPLTASLRAQWNRRWGTMLALGTVFTGAAGESRFRALVSVDVAPYIALASPPAQPRPAVSMASAAASAQAATFEPVPTSPHAAAETSLPPPQTRTWRLPEQLYFALEASDLIDPGHAVVRRVVAYLLGHPEVTALEVTGYTDNTGPTSYNEALSLRRAQAVRSALLRHGIAPERVVALGRGAQDFAVSNVTRPGRERNRRVQFRACTKAAPPPAHRP